MKVVITGGTGFIGSRLAVRCAGAGDSVTVLGQENTPAEAANRAWLEGQGVAIVAGSVTDAGAVARCVDGAEAVYHLAAAQHEAHRSDRHFHEVNVSGTQRMLEAAGRAGARRFVHGSTIGVYGALGGLIDERSPCQPDNIYGRTKLAGEQCVREFAGSMETVIVRISETYGAGDRRLLKLFRAIDRGRFFMIGGGRNLHHPVYIDDLVDGMRAAAIHPGAAGGLCVLAGPRAVSTADMAAAIAAALGRPPPRLNLPLWPFMAAAWLLETTMRPLGLQPPLHRRRMDFFRKSYEFAPEGAQRLIGYAPAVDFAQGARLTAAWYREQGLL